MKPRDEDDDPPMMCPRTGMYCSADASGFDCEAYGCAREAGIDIDDGDEPL
ncbi:MAG: hypothetical protein ING19_21170 [Azospirillum sp.]|nr:hypothetical protein [Azospirillum sp.]MCA3268564.1 hypothetical protein [Azospirillum sp.]